MSYNISRKGFNLLLSGKRLIYMGDNTLYFHISIFPVNMAHARKCWRWEIKSLKKLGFYEPEPKKHSDIIVFYFDVADEYVETIKNLLTLAYSTVPANQTLAYQMFQNLKQFKIKT